MVKFSIIIPVYNACKFLPKCIDCLLDQSYKDFELLLVDDGSQDESLLICEKFAALDNRVVVYHKKNGGPSSARNLGLNKANGHFILFVDSDDWVETDYLSRVNDLVQAKDADLYVLGFTVDYSSRTEVFELKRSFYKKDEICDFIGLELKNRHWGNPWNKIFKNDIIQNNNILFDESMNYSEDALFNFCYAKYCNSIYSSEIISYHYRNFENQGSLSKRILQFQENQDILNKLVLEGFKISTKEDWTYSLNAYLLNEMTLWLLKCPKDENLILNVKYYLKSMPQGRFPIYVLSGIKGFVFRWLINIGSPNILYLVLKHR